MVQQYATPWDLPALLRDVPGRKDFARPLAPLTSIRIGGPADVLVRIETISTLRCLQAIVREHAIPLFILGGGSNLLIRDGGIRGIVVLLSDFLSFGDFEKPFNRLFSAGLEIFGVQILSPTEINPELTGDIRFVGQPRVVVAPDLRVHPELTEILHEVEHEAVVIVDDQNPHQARLPVVVGLSNQPDPRAGRSASAPARCSRRRRRRRGPARCSPGRIARRTACIA